MGASKIPGSGIVTITDCTFTGNTAQGGAGGLEAFGGDGLGAGIFNLDGSVTLNDDTLAANTVNPGAGGYSPAGPSGSHPGQADGGAVYSLADGNRIEDGQGVQATLTLNNSILATTNGGTDLAAQVLNDPISPNANSGTITGSNNLIGAQNVANTTLGMVVVSTADPQLGQLLDNGGPTQTMALPAGSPAVGAGKPGVAGVPSTDQRGQPRLVGGRLDLGAYEFQGTVSTPPTPPQPVGLLPTTTTLSYNVETNFGLTTAVTLFAQVVGPSGQPVTKGLVQFTSMLGTATGSVVNGIATAQLPLSVGQDLTAVGISASYSDPSGAFAGSVGTATIPAGSIFSADYEALVGCVAAFFGHLVPG
jgi:hypothetical protein